MAQPATSAPVVYPVGLRVLHLSRGPGRPLPTLVFYPTARWWFTSPGRQPADLPAPGRFPLVLFSHGLRGSPQRYSAALTGWAAAGFVVVAPTFPHTSEFATHFRRSDIARQPADVRYVLAQIRRLDATPGTRPDKSTPPRTNTPPGNGTPPDKSTPPGASTPPGDPLAGHIDTTRIAAIGHSAGGYTTAGLFTAGHDPSLRAAVIMAGWLAPGAFAGPPATILFLREPPTRSCPRAAAGWPSTGCRGPSRTCCCGTTRTPPT